MKPLIVLLAAFGISLGILFYLQQSWQWQKAGCIAMAIMMLFTAIAHFASANGMKKMLPAFLPFKKEIVLLTGLLEVSATIGMLLPTWQTTTGWWLIAFFVLILPANIWAAMRHIHPVKGTPDGPGPVYLWFRVPLQFFFMGWVYLFAIALA